MNTVMQMNQVDQMPPVMVRAAQQDRWHSINVEVQIQDHLAHIAVSGRFDFPASLNFRNTYVPLLDNAAVQQIRVEMSKVVYLDSSAMGMLLLLNERARVVNKAVTLCTAPGVVSQVLEVANFSKIFSIEHVEPDGNKSWCC